MAAGNCRPSIQEPELCLIQQSQHARRVPSAEILHDARRCEKEGRGSFARFRHGHFPEWRAARARQANSEALHPGSKPRRWIFRIVGSRVARHPGGAERRRCDLSQRDKPFPGGTSAVRHRLHLGFRSASFQACSDFWRRDQARQRGGMDRRSGCIRSLSRISPDQEASSAIHERDAGQWPRGGGAAAHLRSNRLDAHRH